MAKSCYLKQLMANTFYFKNLMGNIFYLKLLMAKTFILKRLLAKTFYLKWFNTYWSFLGPALQFLYFMFIISRVVFLLHIFIGMWTYLPIVRMNYNSLNSIGSPLSNLCTRCSEFNLNIILISTISTFFIEILPKIINN